MFVFLSKFLPLFVYPLGLACILLVLALLLRAKSRLWPFLLLAALLILWLSSTALVANGLARSLEWKYLPPDEVPALDTAVVLGGGTEPSIYPRSGVEVTGAGDRVLYAARLYREGKIKHILLSGGEIEWLTSSTSSPAEDMAALLTEIGIPQEALWLEGESRNTHENAVYGQKMLEEKGIQKVLLITSAMHMPRSVALFEKLGVEVIPLPVDYSIIRQDENTGNGDLIGQLLGFLPSAGNLVTTTNALKEYLGILTYTLQGWL